MYNVFLLFREGEFYIIFQKKFNENSENPFVQENAIKIIYQNIMNIIHRKRNLIVIGLKEEPEWISLKSSQTPEFQRKGFKTLILEGDSKHIKKSKAIINSHCSIIRILSICNKIDLDFTIPDSLEKEINDEIQNIINVIINENLITKFEEYGMKLKLHPRVMTLDSIYPLISLLSLPGGKKYNQLMLTIEYTDFTIPTKIEWTTLTEEESFYFDCTSPITIIKSIAMINTEFNNFDFILKSIHAFISSGVWFKTKNVKYHKPISLFFMKIYNRDLWTTPGISFELIRKNYCILTINILTCEEFIQNFHKNHPGRFKEGRNKFWLPQIYNVSFVIQETKNGLLIECFELIGWYFDCELSKVSFLDFIQERGLLASQFASYLINLISNPEIIKFSTQI